MKFTVSNEIELIDKIYCLLRDKLRAGFKVGLIGDLGAGKTALVKGLLARLKVNEPVTSPTFILRKIYQAQNGLRIQHIDLYRHPKGEKNLEIVEWLEEKDYLTFVEWPENMDAISYDVLITIKTVSATSRELDIKWN